MAQPLVQSYGAFSKGRKTATAGTAIVILIPPFSNQGMPGLGTGKMGLGVPHITHMIVDGTTTKQTIGILRPQNFTTFSANAAAGQAVVSLTADPGVYSTNWKYGLPNGQSGPRTADDAIASGDYCVYQAADGTYIADTAAGSYTSGTVTMTTNLPTGGVLQGGLFWLFGQTADTDPNTGEPHLSIDTTGAAARIEYTDANGLWCALHQGDPLLIVDPNATAADTWQLVAGYYAKH